MVLSPNEYDISYFDGHKTTYRHNAGYTRYERFKGYNGENSLGELWKDKTKKLFDTHSLSGKKVLEIGCAKGFIVEDLRSFGVDCYGLDVSPYAVGEASNSVKPFLTVADAKTYLSNYKNNEFDVVFSLRFLECIDVADLPTLISEINRISKFQFHEIDETSNKYYLEKPLNWWKKFEWNKGSLLVSNTNKDVLVK
ncbi:hypothetical protein LCGC14_1857470 [marine sediment metagenome]|uniref:Methyltransferase type 11 domain-containing protein n=1 Tax=marine sediment metagenome TaxID=412755 RepID=A0A0F9IMY3_9ZZZZ